ncbi:unnamed protein product [Symbiodinium sp. CCMP2592]|nr:unnamed protein product [Symbiodinium sp. CCMP2592]
MLCSLQARAPDHFRPLFDSPTCSRWVTAALSPPWPRDDQSVRTDQITKPALEAMGKNKGSKQKKDKVPRCAECRANATWGQSSIKQERPKICKYAIGPPITTLHNSEKFALDAEIAGQVKEVEERLQALTVEMKQIEGKIKHCLLEGKRAELTEKELQPMPEEMKVYRQVGKMFILQPKSDLARSLKAQVALKTVESQTLKQALNKIQDKVKSEANGLKELIGPERMKQLFQSGGSAGAAAEGSVLAGTVVNRDGNSTAHITIRTTRVLCAFSPSEDAMMPLFGKQTESEKKPLPPLQTDSKAENSDKTKNGTGADNKASETEKAPATVEV